MSERRKGKKKKKKKNKQGFKEKILDIRHAIISQSTIIHPLQIPPQRLQTKIRPRTPRNKRILQILLPPPLRPLHALRPPVLAQISALGKHHQPHRLQTPLSASAPTRQLPEPSRQARGVSPHVPGHEHETREAETEPHERDVQDRFFEHDVDVAVVGGEVGVGGPPEVDPVVVELGVQNYWGFQFGGS